MKAVPKICMAGFIVVGLIACLVVDVTIAERWLIPGIENNDVPEIAVSATAIGIFDIVTIIAVVIICRRIYRKFYPPGFDVEMSRYKSGNVGLD